MATVQVRRDDFEDGVLPLVCVGSGAPADRPYRTEVSWSPSWSWLLIFAGPLGWVAMAVADQAYRRTAVGDVPYADAYHRVLEDRRRIALRVLAVGVVAVGNGVVAWALLDELRGFGVVLVAAGVLAAVAGGVLAARVPGSLKGTPDESGRWVGLEVHPAFADAYLAQEARRRHTRRREALDHHPAP